MPLCHLRLVECYGGPKDGTRLVMDAEIKVVLFAPSREFDGVLVAVYLGDHNTGDVAIVASELLAGDGSAETVLKDMDCRPTRFQWKGEQAIDDVMRLYQ